jgi:hypothetical protein
MITKCPFIVESFVSVGSFGCDCTHKLKAKATQWQWQWQHNASISNGLFHIFVVFTMFPFKFPMGSQHVPQQVPNSSSIYPISLAVKYKLL